MFTTICESADMLVESYEHRLVINTAHKETRDLCSFKYSVVLTMQLRPLTLDGK
jgi:hypothetical protein